MEFDGHVIDKIFEGAKSVLQHRFFIMLAGTYLWFVLKWSWMRNHGKISTWKEFRSNQKDEWVVTLSFGMASLIWDDEFINAFLFTKDWLQGNLTEEWTAVHLELPGFMYLLIGPAIERLYSIRKILHRNGKQ